MDFFLLCMSLRPSDDGVPASFITPSGLMMMPSKKDDGDGVITRKEEDEVIILQWCTLGDRYSVKLRGEHYSKG